MMKTPQETHSEDGLILITGIACMEQQARTPVICAWCEGVMEEGSGPVSHGMCPSCHADFLATLPEE
jgi:hypothetical protein